MKIVFAKQTELDALDRIYDDAFESNPSPAVIVLSEAEQNAVDMTPSTAYAQTDKTVLSVYLENEIVGGAVITQSENGLNVLDRLFVSPVFHGKGIGFAVWKEIENRFSNNTGWLLKCPTYLTNNACFYINKCGFSITAVEEIDAAGIGMFVYTKTQK